MNIDDDELDDTDLGTTIDWLTCLHESLCSLLAAGTRVEGISDEELVMEIRPLLFGLAELKAAIADLRRLRRKEEKKNEARAWATERWRDDDRWDDR